MGFVGFIEEEQNKENNHRISSFVSIKFKRARLLVHLFVMHFCSTKHALIDENEKENSRKFRIDNGKRKRPGNNVSLQNKLEIKKKYWNKGFIY